MKKIVSLFMVLLLGMTMVSCSKKQEQQNVGMPNPIKEYEKLEDINGKAGTHLVIPSSFAVSEVRYSTINDETSQIDFKMESTIFNLARIVI